MSVSKAGIFTGEDHDMDLRPVRVVPAVGDSSIRKMQAGAALTLLKRWGLGLLDPDVVAHKRTLPDNWWLEEANTTPVPVGVQEYFPAALAGIRETLAERKERNELPFTAWEAHQETSVPKDEVLLNLWYYLAALGYTVVPEVKKTADGFTVRIVVTS